MMEPLQNAPSTSPITFAGPKFGVAGFPPAFGRSALGKDRFKICEWLRKIGLDALELQMTFGPRTSEADCLRYRQEAGDWGIKLSVHASYFIVLTSDDPVKLRNSRETLKRTFDLSNILGADAIVLHPGSVYKSKEPRPILERCIQNVGDVMNSIGLSEIGLFVETAGKTGQLGSVNEILEISNQVPGVFPCIDFGHVHARTGGSLDSERAIFDLFESLDNRGCFGTDRRIHFHYTPIEFGPSGEIRHRRIGEMNGDISYGPAYEHVASGLRKWQPNCTVISETSNSQEEGALALWRAYT
jgi:deoxyribonuclease-4